MLAFGNSKPRLLGRLLSRKWELPFGIVVREDEQRQRTQWQLEFTRSGAEQAFLALCAQLQEPLQVLFVDDPRRGDEGMTLIQPVQVSAPAGDLASRKRFAALLWGLVHELWLAELCEAPGSYRIAPQGSIHSGLAA